ncbi:MAG: serine/threonine-protein kinase [Minicystis sp.]
MKLGTYELLREQGGIGAGTVWFARAEGEGEGARPLSVVRVHKHLLKKPEVAEAFLAEVTPAIGFTHANVTAVIDAKSDGGELFVVTENPEGELLSALSNSAGPNGLPQPVVLRIALDVLEALAAAHEREPGLFHGELGPHQVLVGSDGVARVTGLAMTRALSRISAPIGPKNQERLAYAAPERVKPMSTPGGAASMPAPDARADLFSVAVMLWEGLAKQRLFGSKIDAAIVQKVLTGAIAALDGIAGAGVPADLSGAVAKALERDPAKRTRSAAMLIAAIEGLGADKIAAAKDVAEIVEKLAGKAIAARRAEAAKPAAKPLGSAAKPAEAAKPTETPKPAEAAKPAPLPRKATLLGIPAPTALKPAAATKPAEAASKTEAAPASTPKPPSKPEAKPPSTPNPAAAAPPSAKPPIRVDEGLEDDEDWAEPEPAKAEPPKPPKPAPPAPPAKRTLVMGSQTPALRQAIAAADKAPEAPKAAPESTKPSAGTVQLDTSGGKTAHTPSTGDRSPSARGRIGTGTEKVAPGTTLGRYEILMPVARGGMASVWAARLPGSRGFQKIFAIKTMLPDVSDDPDFENMFLDEGRIAARIRHPNVVEIIDLGEQSEVLYLVMEWVDGENLGSLVKAARALGGIPLPVVIKIASQIAAGLHAAHELRDDDGNLVDLVHRDVSPANVLVSSSGYVKIVDFGIAKSKGRLHQTRVGGVVKGKTPYLSPEQLGQLPIDRRSDIFSFGVLLYVLTTGLHPFRGETDAKTIENIALREPVPLRNIVPSTPPEFEAVVLKALRKEPKDRYTTAADMQRALDHAAATVGATTTEEDVATFVKQALGELLTKRSQELRASIDRADGRTPSAVEVAPAPEAPPTAKPPAVEPSVSEPEIKPREVITLHDITLGDDPLEKKPEAAPAVAAAPPGDEVAIEEEPAAASPRPEPAPEVPAFTVTAHPAVPPPPPEPEPELPPPPPAPPAELEAPRPAAASDSATEAPLEIPGAPKKRKPVAAIVIGAVLGLGAIIGGIAIFAGGGGKADPPVRVGSTAAPTTTATAAPKPASTPSAVATPAPVPTETAAPAGTGAAPADTGAAATPSRPAGKGAVPSGGRPRPPTPPSKKSNTGKTYNPPGIWRSMTRASWKRHAAVAAIFAAPLLTAGGSALAQPKPPPPPPGAAPVAGDTQKATALYLKGSELFKAKKFIPALEQFRLSYQTVPSPNSHLYIARCLAALGETREAWLEFDKVAEEAAARAATEAKYAPTRDSANVERDELTPKLGLVTIDVLRPERGSAVYIGTLRVSQDRWSRPYPIEPGTHEVRVETPGRPVVKTTLAIRGGERRAVQLDAGVGGGATHGPTPVASGSKMSPLRIGGIVAAGVGVAGFAMFAAGGILSSGTYSDLKTTCGGDTGGCHGLDVSDQISKGKTQQAIANAGLIIGAVGVAAGVTMIVISTRTKKDAGRPSADSGAEAELGRDRGYFLERAGAPPSRRRSAGVSPALVRAGQRPAVRRRGRRRSMTRRSVSPDPCSNGSPPRRSGTAGRATRWCRGSRPRAWTSSRP